MKKNRYLQAAKNLLQQLKIKGLQQLKTLDYQMGIDQAGRGPVFGAMIYSGLWWPIIYKQRLQKLGFDDSKKLTQIDRQQLFEMLQSLKQKLLFYKADTLSAQYISNKMLGQGKHYSNLNQISHNSAIGLIKYAQQQGFKIKNVYIDTVGTQSKYQQKIYQALPKSQIVIKVSKKADSIYKIVGAASIVAKVTRDHIINNWKFQEKINPIGDLGSGYPSDPKTVQWLKNNLDQIFGFPNLIRFSWNTIPNLMKQRILFVDQLQQKNKSTNALGKKFGIICTGKQFFSQN